MLDRGMSGHDVPFDSITRNEDLDGDGALNGRN